jgi:AbrB family looped-hinge helix DNA binding protein
MSLEARPSRSTSEVRLLEITKLSTKGQVVIPKRLREALGLEVGDHLVLLLEGDRLILRKPSLEELLEESERNYREGKTLSHEEAFEGLS